MNRPTGPKKREHRRNDRDKQGLCGRQERDRRQESVLLEQGPQETSERCGKSSTFVRSGGLRTHRGTLFSSSNGGARSTRGISRVRRTRWRIPPIVVVPCPVLDRRRGIFILWRTDGCDDCVIGQDSRTQDRAYLVQDVDFSLSSPVLACVCTPLAEICGRGGPSHLLQRGVKVLC